MKDDDDIFIQYDADITDIDKMKKDIIMNILSVKGPFKIVICSSHDVMTTCYGDGRFETFSDYNIIKTLHERALETLKRP